MKFLKRWKLTAWLQTWVPQYVPALVVWLGWLDTVNRLFAGAGGGGG